MTVALHEGRSRRRNRRAARDCGQDRGPSVREVCLVGRARGWSAGDVVTWSGRVYRVESAPPAREACYAHLAPAAVESAGG